MSGHRLATRLANRRPERVWQSHKGQSQLAVLLELESRKPPGARFALLDRANAAGRVDLIAEASRRSTGLQGFEERVDEAWAELELLLRKAGA